MPLSEELRRRQDDLIKRGEQVYEDKLKPLLEPTHIGEYVVIEPNTGRYFLGRTAHAATDAALAAMPNDTFYLARVGYQAAFKIGGSSVPRRR